MLTDEQARRFCVCEDCGGTGGSGQWDICGTCGAAGIDPDKRAELEEMLREAKEAAWSEGYQEGCSNAGTYDPWGRPCKSNNPYAKAPTNG